MMRAKMQVTTVDPPNGTTAMTVQTINMVAVSTTPFGTDGESEDNTYARWTPTGACSLTITNLNLIGKFTSGQKFYLDFTEAANPVPQQAPAPAAPPLPVAAQ